MLFENPIPDCSLCPRLADFRTKNQVLHPDFFNAPVPAFGSLDVPILIVGLAPGLKGANAKGRPFTGDYAGDILYAALQKHGFATGSYQKRADDGFCLVGCRVSNAVRCVPPENKPETYEINSCNMFLKKEIAAMPNLRVILSLGNIAHNAVLKALGLKAGAAKFAHAAQHDLGKIILLNTYHTSRYNMNTRRLTEAMFDAVIADIKRL